MNDIIYRCKSCKEDITEVVRTKAMETIVTVRGPKLKLLKIFKKTTKKYEPKLGDRIVVICKCGKENTKNFGIVGIYDEVKNG